MRQLRGEAGEMILQCYGADHTGDHLSFERISTILKLQPAAAKILRQHGGAMAILVFNGTIKDTGVPAADQILHDSLRCREQLIGFAAFKGSGRYKVELPLPRVGRREQLLHSRNTGDGTLLHTQQGMLSAQQKFVCMIKNWGKSGLSAFPQKAHLPNQLTISYVADKLANSGRCAIVLTGAY